MAYQYEYRNELSEVKWRMLTQKQRDEIQAGMTSKQVHALAYYQRYEWTSWFMQQHFLIDTEWEFAGFQQNPWYPAAMPNGEKLYCDCGRMLKNQYLLKSKRTGDILALGSVHFTMHAQLDPKIAQLVNQEKLRIDRTFDESLTRFKKGQHFPTKLWLDFKLKDVLGADHHRLYDVFEPLAAADVPLVLRDARLLARRQAEQVHALLENGYDVPLVRRRIEAELTRRFAAYPESVSKQLILKIITKLSLQADAELPTELETALAGYADLPVLYDAWVDFKQLAEELRQTEQSDSNLIKKREIVERKVSHLYAQMLQTVQ
ncbi:hypothetical protein [Weissella soli]|uniref:hypothetical protein n=1 Tax=Weissella soli TaxID=155866 RepID=UPI0035A0AC6A